MGSHRLATGSALPTRAIKILLVAVAYYVAGRLGLQLSLVKENVTPLWPPTGIALVAFLILGPKIWPGVALGALAVNLPISTSLWAAGATAAGNTLAPFVASKLLGRVGFRKELDRLRDAVAIVFLGALVAMAVSATVGTGVLVLSGAIPPGKFVPAWAVWWTGDAMGVLVVAPFLLSLFLPRDRSEASWGRRAEAIGLFIALTLMSLGIAQAGLRLFIVFPVLGWAAWRFEQRGAAPAALIVAGCATWAAAHGWGPFEGSTLFGKMLTLQAFNAAVAFSSFVFAAMVTERVQAREALEMAAADLEQRVVDRTSALAAANERLSHEEGVLRTSLELLRATDEQRRQLVSRYWLPERIDATAPRSPIDQVATITTEAEASGSSSPRLVVPERTGARTGDTDATSEAWSWGLWRGRALLALPDRQGRGSNFGLHNRDLPTLWALDQLASRVADLGEPVQWKDFNRSLRVQAQTAGQWLRDRDRARPHTLRAATGFPKPGPKASLSEDRFIMANVAHRASSREGPFQVLGVASFVDGERMAPTGQGLSLLGRLLDAGLSDELPHGPEVFWAWWSYLEEAAPAERRAWARVLRELRIGPTRVELISRFPEWPGSTGETNCMGFVSRSREWGLVQPKLLDGRYLLTTVGVSLIEQEEARRPARSGKDRAAGAGGRRRVRLSRGAESAESRGNDGGSDPRGGQVSRSRSARGAVGAHHEKPIARSL